MAAGANVPRLRTFVSTRYERAPDLSRINQSATAALDKLSSMGVNRQQLLNFVAAILIASCKPLYIEGDWAVNSGHSLRSFKELPERVRAWADEVERVNNYRSNGVALLDPELFVSPEWSTNCLTAFFPNHSPSSLGMGIILKQLPNLLRAYGAYLEAQISAISAEVADLERVSTFELDFTALLCEFVHQATDGQHYCYEELADLLTAVYQLDGQYRIASAGALRMNRERHASSERTPKVLGFELDGSRQILSVLIEIKAPAMPAQAHISNTEKA